MTSTTLERRADTTRTNIHHEKYHVTVEQYVQFRSQGFLAVPGLVSQDDIAELRQHTEDLMQGRLPEQQISPEDEVIGADGVRIQHLAPPPAELSPEEKAQFYLRIHMLHRQLALHERYMLHPRVLDVMEVLIGPDLLALQTMLFLKPPGKPGQGWHQDSYYIPSHPDTLCGAWIAIDDCDELNGAMWFAAGSQNEPVYPPKTEMGFGTTIIDSIDHVAGVSNPDDDKNDLSRIADRYPQLLVPAKAGDVVFFGGHVIHRSKKNFSTDRFRRSFVSHYINARSFTQTFADTEPGHPVDNIDPLTGMTNGSQILARGDSHLPFAQPKFGTACAATLTAEERRNQSASISAAMGDMDSGQMDMMPAEPKMDDH